MKENRNMNQNKITGQKRIKIIGLTGGTGSGKSAVSIILTGLGAIVIDSDLIARDIVGKGQPALDELIGFFGQKILDRAGELDRKILGEIVFNDPEKLKILNKITHKYIIEKIIKMLDDIKREDIEQEDIKQEDIKTGVKKDIKKDGQTEVVVVEAPIPVEHGFLDTVDEVWVVTAAVETRIKRIVQRSGLSRDEAASRINAQMKDEDYLDLADRIIDNDGSFEMLKRQVTGLYKKVREEILE